MAINLNPTGTQQREAIKNSLQTHGKATLKQLEKRTGLSKSCLSQHLLFLESAQIVRPGHQQSTSPKARPGDLVKTYELKTPGFGSGT